MNHGGPWSLAFNGCRTQRLNMHPLHGHLPSFLLRRQELGHVQSGGAEVLVEHCTRSNAGLFYQDRDEFVEAAKLLLADERLRDRMGRNGKEYVKRHYRWDVIMSKYDKLIGALKS